MMDSPAPQFRIEPREHFNVIGVEYNAPPIVTLPAVRVIAYPDSMRVKRLLGPARRHTPLRLDHDMVVGRQVESLAVVGAIRLDR